MAGARTTPADPTATFFDALAERGHEPLLRGASGSVRFDIVDGRKIDRRLVVIDGDWRLLVLVQRLFPGPPRRRPGRRGAAAKGKARS